MIPKIAPLTYEVIELSPEEITAVNNLTASEGWKVLVEKVWEPHLARIGRYVIDCGTELQRGRYQGIEEAIYYPTLLKEHEAIESTPSADSAEADFREHIGAYE